MPSPPARSSHREDPPRQRPHQAAAHQSGAARVAGPRRGPRLMEIARAVSERGELVLAAAGRRGAGVAGERRVCDGRRETSSEELLASAALAAVRRPERVLVGGLGLVHRAGAPGRCSSGSVVVAEIEPELVTWMRDGAGAVGAGRSAGVGRGRATSGRCSAAPEMPRSTRSCWMSTTGRTSLCTTRIRRSTRPTS